MQHRSIWLPNHEFKIILYNLTGKSEPGYQIGNSPKILFLNAKNVLEYDEQIITDTFYNCNLPNSGNQNTGIISKQNFIIMEFKW